MYVNLTSAKKQFTMKVIAILAILLTSTASQPICNDQERRILNEKSRNFESYHLIYAMDEILSSRNSLNAVFKHLNFSFRNPQIPFIFDRAHSFEFSPHREDGPGFCPSSIFFDRLDGQVKWNETMLGVFYGCSLRNNIEFVYVIVDHEHPQTQNTQNITINRASESSFCKCRQMEETFIRSCLPTPDNTNLGMLVVLSSVVVVLAFLVALKTLTSRSSKVVDVCVK